LAFGTAFSASPAFRHCVNVSSARANKQINSTLCNSLDDARKEKEIPEFLFISYSINIKFHRANIYRESKRANELSSRQSQAIQIHHGKHFRQRDAISAKMRRQVQFRIEVPAS
jgi:hypothetical protein